MSLSDSLKRVAQEGSAKYRAEVLTAKYVALVQQSIEKRINEEADKIFQKICDNIAEEIADSAFQTGIHVEGFVEMPGSLSLNFRDINMDFYDTNREFVGRRPTYVDSRPIMGKEALSKIPCLKEDRDSHDIDILLTTTSKTKSDSVIFGFNYHRKESMTQYGTQLVSRIRDMAQKDGISIESALLYEERNPRSGKIRKTEVPYNTAMSDWAFSNWVPNNTIRMVKYSYN